MNMMMQEQGHKVVPEKAVVVKQKQVNRPSRSTTMPEKYFHVRLKKPLAVGLRNERLIHAVTVFARPDKDGNWFVSQAECDHRDNFSRKEGRTKARRKWFSGKKYAVPGNPNWEMAMQPYLKAVMDAPLAVIL